MDNVLAILSCLLVGFIISGIIFGIIASRDYEKDSNKPLIISTIVIAIMLFGFNSLYNTNLSETKSLESEIEELKEENSKVKEEKDDLQSQLDELQNEYENSKELNDLLLEQLESYGIEPYDL